MLTKPFLQAKPILKKLESYGYEAYFVGGCIRDQILNRDIGDVDIATSARPEEVQDIFEKVIPVGIEHGTVIVRHEGESYEVTTFRLDGKYSDQRHPDQVEFIRNVDEDLQRRDFTMNALAMNLSGNIIDLFNGKEDIKNGVIKTVGSSEERFKEDALRMIRAIRFSSQLGFSIEKDTLSAIQLLKADIAALAIERILNEFEKLLKGTYLKNGIAYLEKLEVYRYLPVLKDIPDLFIKLPNEIIPLYSFAEFIALVNTLYPDISVHEWTKQWKCSNKIKNNAIQLTKALSRFHEVGLDHLLLYNVDQSLDDGLIRLVQILYPNRTIDMDGIKEVRSQLQIKRKEDLALNGQEIISLFPNHKKGPWIRNLIQDLEIAVVQNQTKNTKYDLKEWIKCNPPVIN